MGEPHAAWPEYEGVVTFSDKYFRDLFAQLCVQAADALENEQLEIKGWCNDERQLAEKVSDAAVCLANANGGVVLVGIGEDLTHQKFSRCPHHITPCWLVERVHDTTHPPVGCEAIDLSGVLQDVTGRSDAHAYALIVQRKKCVSGHSNSKGISRIRVGKVCKPQFLAEDDRTGAVVPDLTVDDLSTNSMGWAIREHHRRYKTSDSLLDAEAFLHQTGLVQNQNDGAPPRVTLAALLLFGKEASLAAHVPYCETIVNLHGATTRLRKNLLDSVRDLILTDHSLLRSNCPSVPEETLREILVNAYIHRCWRTNAPILISVDNERLEIANPGDLLPSLTVNSLLYCLPAYRNLLLADGVRIVGLADKIGAGINIIMNTVLRGGFDFPIFESSNNEFRVTVPLARSEEFREFVRRRAPSLSQLDELVVLRSLWARAEISFDDLNIALQRGDQSARKILQGMQDKHMIEPLGAAGYQLAATLRLDIQRIFQADQLDLFGAA